MEAEDEGEDHKGFHSLLVFCFCFFVSQCLGSVLCGEIHCRLLTCCFFIFLCGRLCVCICNKKQRGQDPLSWKVKWEK